MAYDETLAERIRELIGERADLSEAKVFGGLAFLINGNMAVGASGNGGMIVRVAADDSDELAATTEARAMEMRGKTMRGWLRVADEHVETKRQLERGVETGVGYAAALPPKPKT